MTFWERMQIDLVDMRYKAELYIDGQVYSYICHAIDHHSGFNILWAQKKKEAVEVAHNCGVRIFAYFGLPRIFHSDNGTEFKNQLVFAFIKKWPGTCKVVHGRPRCPWVQGKVEQSNGTMQKLLAAKMLELKTDKWVDLLPEIQYTMNINMQNVTKTTPFNIVFGQNPNLG
jgi:transposase InsO family protein